MKKRALTVLGFSEITGMDYHFKSAYANVGSMEENMRDNRMFMKEFYLAKLNENNCIVNDAHEGGCTVNIDDMIQNISFDDGVITDKGFYKIKKNLPTVYFLVKDSIVIYIGSSFKNFYSRISSHQKDKDFDTVHYIEVNLDESKLFSLEKRLICKFNPPLNKVKYSNTIEDGLLDKRQIKELK